jgi:hypothetical protein
LALMPAFDVVCALLVLAGLLKLARPSGAARSLEQAGAIVSRAVVQGLGLVEVAIGAAAAAHPGPLTAGLVALAYAGFAAFTLRLWRFAGEANCGCFGGSKASVGPIHFGLNVCGCALAALAAISPPPGLAWIAQRTPLIAVPLVIGSFAAGYAAYLAFTVLPVAWSTYGSSGE